MYPYDYIILEKVCIETDPCVHCFSLKFMKDNQTIKHLPMIYEEEVKNYFKDLGLEWKLEYNEYYHEEGED